MIFQVLQDMWEKERMSAFRWTPGVEAVWPSSFRQALLLPFLHTIQRSGTVIALRKKPVFFGLSEKYSFLIGKNFKMYPSTDFRVHLVDGAASS